TVAAPTDTTKYTAVSFADTLRVNMRTPEMLKQADSVITSELENFFSQAAGVMFNQSTTVNMHGHKTNLKAKIENSIYYMDYSTGSSEEMDEETIYQDGKLTTTTNGGLPSTDTGYTWQNIQTYLNETMLSSLPDVDFLKDLTVTDLGSLYLLEYEFNDNFGNTMQNTICQQLWNDQSFLLNLSSKYENKSLTGYLSLDKYTGLPVAAGGYYEGVHTIDGQDYIMTMQYDQSIETPALGAYKEITDALPEEPEPESTPTPLFYHVTGANGQEMWLFGTIHVGDEKTGHLPEEIRKAFEGSDALALECDSEAFDEQMEEDEDLAAQVSNLYFYADGTTRESLLEAEEYEQALKLMKAVGGYTINMPYAKPGVWSDTIELFYLRQGYNLHRDYGVEERLCDWAEELGTKIIEVESSLFQIQMTTGFSQDLQLELLRGTLEGTAQEYWEGVDALYDKWCAGDEAALREEISTTVDTSEMTDEEKAEYEATKHLLDEYNNAMGPDRNEGMLKKAIEYLESGDVIFYAVGLAHLLDETNGLVDTLQDAGYTVEKVTFAN
ncbi:MAG: TraB/GumN family protein, partial [Oscillospiraceae bacterium]|nr:TraB/GumN family protein [Oscillospiraceae bacterium]